MKKILFSLLALSATITTPAMADLSSDYQDKDSAYDMCIANSSSNRTIWENDRGHGVIVSSHKVYYVNNSQPSSKNYVEGINLSQSNVWGNNTNSVQGSTFNCDSIKYEGKYGVQESEYVSGVSVGQYYFSGGTYTNLWKMETQGDTRILIHYSQKDGGEIEKVIYR